MKKAKSGPSNRKGGANGRKKHYVKKDKSIKNKCGNQPSKETNTPTAERDRQKNSSNLCKVPDNIEKTVQKKKNLPYSKHTAPNLLKTPEDNTEKLGTKKKYSPHNKNVSSATLRQSANYPSNRGERATDNHEKTGTRKKEGQSSNKIASPKLQTSDNVPSNREENATDKTKKNKRKKKFVPYTKHSFATLRKSDNFPSSRTDNVTIYPEKTTATTSRAWVKKEKTRRHTTSNQLPTTCNQLPTTSNQLPTTSNQLPVTINIPVTYTEPDTTTKSEANNAQPCYLCARDSILGALCFTCHRNLFPSLVKFYQPKPPSAISGPSTSNAPRCSTRRNKQTKNQLTKIYKSMRYKTPSYVLSDQNIQQTSFPQVPSNQNIPETSFTRLPSNQNISETNFPTVFTQMQLTDQEQISLPPCSICHKSSNLGALCAQCHIKLFPDLKNFYGDN